MLWLVERRGGTRERVQVDAAYRSAVREALAAAAADYHLPELLLNGMAYRESVYRLEQVGSRGETGLLQVGVMGRRYCRDACGADATPQEQARCGACWLDAGRRWCGGDLHAGLSAYVGGKCRPKSVRVQRVVQQRERIWRRMHEWVHGEGLPRNAWEGWRAPVLAWLSGGR